MTIQWRCVSIGWAIIAIFIISVFTGIYNYAPEPVSNLASYHFGDVSTAGRSLESFSDSKGSTTSTNAPTVPISYLADGGQHCVPNEKSSADTVSSLSNVSETKVMTFTPSFRKMIFGNSLWDYVEIDGCNHLSTPGEPQMPYKVETVRTQYKLTDVLMEFFSPVIVPHLRIIPADYSITLDKDVKDSKESLDLSYYNQDTYLPKANWDSSLLGIDSRNPEHYYVYSIRIFPMKYNPLQGDAIFYQKCSLKLTFSSEKLLGHSVPITSGNVTYAIITISSLKDSLKPLAEWNTKKGYSAVIYDAVNIYSSTHGADNPEKIHNFIANLKNNNGTKYVLLAGDASDIPPRNCIDPYSVSGIEDGFLPGDTYYACCDGTWGSGGKYGDLGQIDDAIPDVSLTRIAISSSSEMQAWVQDTINYEKNPPTGSWASHVTLVAPDCGANGDPSDVVDYLYNTYLKSTYSTVKKLINTIEPPLPSNIAVEINTGTAFILELSHGDPDGWYNGGGGGSDVVWESAEIGKLSNGIMKPAVFSMSCESNYWDKYQCVGEVFTETAGKGAIGYCGSTRLAMAGVDTSYDPDSIGMQEDFCRALKDGYRHQGEVFMQMKTHYAQSFGTMFKGSGSENAAALKCWNEFDMLGDAVVPYWTETPKSFSVTNSGVSGGLKVTVKDFSTSNPVQGARVCIWMEPDVYSVGDTDTSGIVTLLVGGAAGNANLTVTKPNYIPYEGIIPVSTESVPPVVTITAPVIGAIWLTGQHLIEWTATDNVAVSPNSASILLSVDSGLSWSKLTDNQPSGGPYLYDLQKNTINSNQCIIKVQVIDTSGNPGNGTSDLFTISSSSVTVEVTSPATGALWKGGMVHDVEWTVLSKGLPAKPINISLSTDSGLTWTLITPLGGIPNATSWSWPIPRTIDTIQARIKVTCIDSMGGSGEKVNGDFTIDSSIPLVSITQPIGGTVWSIGSSQIKWIASDTIELSAVPMSIHYSIDNGNHWKIIANSITNSGTYDWVIPTISSKNCIVMVNASDTVGNVGSDSSSVFTIDALKPEIIHTPVPSGIVGTTIHISATAKDDSTVTMMLSYKGVGDSSFTDISMPESGGIYIAQIPPQISRGTVTYHITAIDAQTLMNETDEYTINILDSSQTGSISGKVIDGTNGEGIDSAQVTATLDIGGGSYSTVSELDGTFSIAGMNVGEYVIKTLKQGYVSSAPCNISIESGKEITGVNLVLIPTTSSGGTVMGTITDTSTKPIANASVTITGVGNVFSGFDGKYVIYNILPDTYTIIVSKPGYKTYTDSALKVNAGAITTKDVTLTKELSVGKGNTDNGNILPISLSIALIAAVMIIILIAVIGVVRLRKKKDTEPPTYWQPQHMQYHGYPAYNPLGYPQQPAQYHQEQQLTDPQIYPQYSLQYQNPPQ